MSLKYVESCKTAHNAKIIDVGGGESLLAKCLIEKGFSEITVLDISAHALEEANKQLGLREGCTFLHQSVLNMVPPEQAFSLWHDRAVFHFLTFEHDKQRYLMILRASLAVGGFIVLATFSLNGPKKCSGLDVEQYDALKMQEFLGDSFLLLQTEEVMHKTPSGSEQEFCYALFRRES